jgi:predicted Na+-dependent transporter
MEAPQNKSDVTIQFLVAGLVIHFAGIFHLSFSVQKLFKNFMLVQWLKIFFQFLGANMTPKNFIANIQTPKRHFLEKICVD